MWKAFQIAIFLAVMFTNIHWHLTPNGYLASLIAIGIAFVVTWALTRMLDIGHAR